MGIEEIILSEYSSLRQLITDLQNIPERWGAILFVYSASILGLTLTNNLSWSSLAILSVMSIVLVILWWIISINNINRIEKLIKIESDLAEILRGQFPPDQKALLAKISTDSKNSNIKKWHINLMAGLFFLTITIIFARFIDISSLI